jgi:hypothetical protein
MNHVLTDCWSCWNAPAEEDAGEIQHRGKLAGPLFLAAERRLEDLGEMWKRSRVGQWQGLGRVPMPLRCLSGVRANKESRRAGSGPAE